MRAAAIYARISSDVEGSGLGVERQLEDCRKLAKSRGWTVAEEYRDDGISAYSGTRRPAYQRMLADLADGQRDAVIVYHPDRLTRRPSELEDFLKVIDKAGVRQVHFVAMPTDVMTGDGLLLLRITAAVAAHESDTKSRRVRRKVEQNAKLGKPHGGRRAFGYAKDGLAVNEDEAAVIRQLATRFLAGESLRSLAVWLEDQGVKTVVGNQWRTPTLRGMLASPRIAGLRQHQGNVLGKAQWSAIITEDEHRRIVALMQQKARSGKRAPRSYLLSGLLRCGKCNATLYSARRAGTVRRYVCQSGPDHGGCGGIYITAEPVELLIRDAVLIRLERGKVADAMAGWAARDEQIAAVAEQLADDQAQLEELVAAYAAKQIPMREWLLARAPIEQRIKAAEQRMMSLSGNEALRGLPSNGAALRGSWDGLNLDRQAAIVRAVLDHAVIAPGVLGARAVDPNRVEPVWRL
ncbi:recombinase family protein [Planosporangium mesophilum]|nr:recombinase family protein [Planosporangium mesophilum]